MSVESVTPGIGSRIAGDEIEILLPRVTPPHRLQHPRRAGLHRQMEVLADLRKIANRLDQPRPGVPRMRAGETDSLDAGHVVDLGEELREVAAGIVRRLIVIHDLPEELNLLPARCDGVPNVGEDVGFGAHPLVAAGVRHHAERAVVVAAFDDGDVGLDRIPAPRDSKRKRDVVPGVDIDFRCGRRARRWRRAPAASSAAASR